MHEPLLRLPDISEAGGAGMAVDEAVSKRKRHRRAESGGFRLWKKLDQGMARTMPVQVTPNQRPERRLIRETICRS
jgi:hypothetical protein